MFVNLWIRMSKIPSLRLRPCNEDRLDSPTEVCPRLRIEARLSAVGSGGEIMALSGESMRDSDAFSPSSSSSAGTSSTAMSSSSSVPPTQHIWIWFTQHGDKKRLGIILRKEIGKLMSVGWTRIPSVCGLCAMCVWKGMIEWKEEKRFLPSSLVSSHEGSSNGLPRCTSISSWKCATISLKISQKEKGKGKKEKREKIFWGKKVKKIEKREKDGKKIIRCRNLTLILASTSTIARVSDVEETLKPLW
jgi:hypothetical protein